MGCKHSEHNSQVSSSQYGMDVNEEWLQLGLPPVDSLISQQINFNVFNDTLMSNKSHKLSIASNKRISKKVVGLSSKAFEND